MASDRKSKKPVSTNDVVARVGSELFEEMQAGGSGKPRRLSPMRELSEASRRNLDRGQSEYGGLRGSRRDVAGPLGGDSVVFGTSYERTIPGLSQLPDDVLRRVAQEDQQLQALAGQDPKLADYVSSRLSAQTGAVSYGFEPDELGELTDDQLRGILELDPRLRAQMGQNPKLAQYINNRLNAQKR